MRHTAASRFPSTRVALPLMPAGRQSSLNSGKTRGGHDGGRNFGAVERARLLTEQAEALGEPLEDPLILFTVLFGLWVSKLQRD